LEKTKWNKKKKIIGTILAIVLLGISIGIYSHSNRTPSITIIEPIDGYTIQSSETIIKGVVDPKDAKLNINGIVVKIEDGFFDYVANLKDEVNIFTIEVSNINKSSQQKITINRIFTEEELAEYERQKAEEEIKKQAVIEAREKAKKEKMEEELAEKKKWEQSKAGQICKTHPEWTKIDCEKLADNKIWIGMTVDMLKSQRGLPNSSNPSNYGYGTDWQWCWHNYTPSCFYGDDDGIVDSYN
jgi:hypothetical protein